MLYLAEVQKKTAFIGGSKAELKLLACQRSDQTWTAVTGEELIPSEEASNFNSGVLVLVNLTQNRQLQGNPQEAGRQLVSILQNFTRVLEKSKNQEEEIEQWKQSLTYQSQELNRREMELESRLEQLHQMEQESERLESERRQIESTRQQAEQLRHEIERSRQELDKAWEYLQVEQQRLSEHQSSALLDNEQLTHVYELLNYITGAIAPTEALREQLNLAFEVVDGQQAVLDYHWQQLEEQRSLAEQMQGEVDNQTQYLQTSKQEWLQAQVSLEQVNGEIKLQQQALELKQETAKILSWQLQSQEELYQRIQHLSSNGGDETGGAAVDSQALEQMPLGELQELVQNLQQDLERFVNFVNAQEEELSFQRETIDELQTQIEQATEFDRMSLDTELVDEEDRYKMLDETLVGQRRNLRDREDFLNQHIRILKRRQGIAEPNGQEGSKINLQPVLAQLDEQKQQKQEELQSLESQIQEMRSRLEETQSTLEHQVNHYQTKQSEWESLEQHLLSSQTAASEVWGKVNTYKEMLQPWQDYINGMRQKLDEIAGVVNNLQSSSEYQLQAVQQIQQLFSDLTTTAPHVAAS